jgi:hypothetical protein
MPKLSRICLLQLPPGEAVHEDGISRRTASDLRNPVGQETRDAD